MSEEVDLKDLSGDELERVLPLVPWYVQPNDLIGGWCIMPIDEPPSQGEAMIVADVISESLAREIVDAHNARLKSPYAPVDGHQCEQPHPDFPDKLCHRAIYHAPHAVVREDDQTTLVWLDSYQGAGEAS